MRFLTIGFVFLGALQAQQWLHYGNDKGGSRYSPLSLIDRGNAARLELAWEYDTGDFSDGKSGYPTRSAFAATPLMIDGVLYVSTPFHRLLALDARNGELLWEFDPQFDRNRRYNLFTSRGVEYWREGPVERLVLGDQNGRIFSIDRKTGKPDPDFGENGMLDTAPDVLGEEGGRYGFTSPISVCLGVLVVGGWSATACPRGPAATSGATTRARGRCAGASIPCRAPENSAARHGRAIRGKTAAA